LPYFAVERAKTINAIYVIAEGVTMSTTLNEETQVELDDNGAQNILDPILSPWESTNTSLAKVTPSSTTWPDKVTVTLRDGSDWSTVTDVLVLIEYTFD